MQQKSQNSVLNSCITSGDSTAQAVLQLAYGMGQSGVGIPAVARHFSPFKNIGTGSRAYPASCSMGTGILSQE
jgi:hypothetical protein